MNRLMMPSFDLTNLDLRRLPRPDRRAVTIARDLTYVSIGFGVLGFQRLQVHRRDLEKTVRRIRHSHDTPPQGAQ